MVVKYKMTVDPEYLFFCLERQMNGGTDFGIGSKTQRPCFMTVQTQTSPVKKVIYDKQL